MKKEKDINYWKNNCEEDLIATPISVLRYISELEKIVAFTKQEISDEEIEKAADVIFEDKVSDNYYHGFQDGAKWYREQLKSK